MQRHKTVRQVDSETEMSELGRALGQRLESGTVVFLSGDLGAGKTTLVRGLLRAIGYCGVVPSPTFTLVEVYNLVKLTVVHLDLYRLDDPAELETLAIRDYLGTLSVLLVEWAERARGSLPDPDCEIRILIDQSGRRRVSLEGFTESGGRLCTA